MVEDHALEILKRRTAEEEGYLKKMITERDNYIKAVLEQQQKIDDLKAALIKLRSI